jgi:hypothetical protein
MKTLQEAAHDLVNALSDALRVFEEQARQAEEARQTSDATHARLMSILESHRTGAGPEAAAQLKEQFAQSPGSYPSLEATMDLSVRWEGTLCGAYEALMRLYAHPSAQETAERVAARLRDLRLLAYEVDLTPPSFSPLPALEGGENDTSDENKRRRAGMMLEYFQDMDGHMEKVLRDLGEKSARTRRLLSESLDEARALLESQE